MNLNSLLIQEGLVALYESGDLELIYYGNYIPAVLGSLRGSGWLDRFRRIAAKNPPNMVPWLVLP